MASKEKAKYRGSLDCARQLYREGGIRSLYRGTAATLLRGEITVAKFQGRLDRFEVPVIVIQYPCSDLFICV